MAIRYSSGSREPRRKTDIRTVRARISSIDDILMYGTRSPSESLRLCRYRSLLRALAIELAPNARVGIARRYLDDAAKLAGYASSTIEYVLTHQHEEKSVAALKRLTGLVQDYVDGRRRLPVMRVSPMKPVVVPALVSTHARSRAVSEADLGSRKLKKSQKKIKKTKRKKKGRATPLPRTYSGATRKPGSHRGTH
jgi:hypothetical protein